MTLRRRQFLALGVAALGRSLAAAAKPLRGIFAIAQSPFTADDRLDLDALAAQVRFLDRGGVHGVVWPQIASEWTTLSDAERTAGAEVVATTARKLRIAAVLGVQSPQRDTALGYARQAQNLGADAVISLPPSENSTPPELLDYYREIGRATPLPLFAQAVGRMTPDAIIEMYQAIPTLRYVKDEAGQPLERIGVLRARSRDELKVFSGSHGRTLIEEMRRGFSGSMPAAAFADLYAQTWDLWQAGKRQEAMAMHARTLLILTDMGLFGTEGTKYLLVLRGVFKTSRARAEKSRLNDAGKQALAEALDFVRPYLKAQ
jgi:4-hydroxy-tetrahydrodipicolinate synthase